MDAVTAQKLVDYAIANPYDGSQAIKQYQQQVGDVTFTLYVDPAGRGHLSLTIKNVATIPSFQSILAQLTLPNCRFVTRTEQKGYRIYRYEFERPSAIEEEKPVETLPAVKWMPDNKPQRPAWLSINDDQCHICHRQLEDPLSIRVKVGVKCRQNIEKAEGKTSAMWDGMTQEELETIWSSYNIYDKRKRERIEKSLPPAMGTAAYDLPPLAANYRPSSGPFTPPGARRTPEPLSLAAMEAATCIFCGQKKTDYWYFDGKTKTCKCRPSSPQGKVNSDTK
jgi:hypothetical protein